MDLNARTEILKRIRTKGRGWVFTPLDFPEARAPEAVKRVLHALVQAGKVREIVEGVFHYPRQVRDLNIEVPPEPMRVAKAFAKLRGHRVAMSGAAAANYLGLSLQVPAKPVYVTDGPDAEVPLGKLTIVLRHAPAECVRVGGDLERALVQAIMYLGRDQVDDKVIVKLRKAIPAPRRPKVLAAARRVGGWVGQVMQEVATPALGEALIRG